MPGRMSRPLYTAITCPSRPPRDKQRRHHRNGASNPSDTITFATTTAIAVSPVRVNAPSSRSSLTLRNEIGITDTDEHRRQRSRLCMAQLDIFKSINPLICGTRMLLIPLEPPDGFTK